MVIKYANRHRLGSVLTPFLLRLAELQILLKSQWPEFAEMRENLGEGWIFLLKQIRLNYTKHITVGCLSNHPDLQLLSLRLWLRSVQGCPEPQKEQQAFSYRVPEWTIIRAANSSAVIVFFCLYGERIVGCVHSLEDIGNHLPLMRSNTLHIAYGYRPDHCDVWAICPPLVQTL